MLLSMIFPKCISIEQRDRYLCKHSISLLIESREKEGHFLVVRGFLKSVGGL